MAFAPQRQVISSVVFEEFVMPSAVQSSFRLMASSNMPPAGRPESSRLVEADAIERGPIARVKTGKPLRSQVHGTWVARDKLAASKRQG